MDRVRKWCVRYCRELPHGSAYLGLVMILMIWLGVWFYLATFKNQLFEAVRQNSANLARAFEEDVVHSVREVDWTLQLLRRNYLQQGDSLDFFNLTRELNNADGLTLQYVIIGPDGYMIHSSVAKSGTRLDLSDREHFRIHVNSKDDNLFISKPILGKASGRWTIQLTRRIVRPDGSFGGVIVASIDPKRFARLYDAIDIGKSGDIILFGQDGIVRSRKGQGEDGSGQSIADSRYFQVAQKGIEGELREKSPLDDTPRAGYYRHVPGFPLIVSVAFAEDEVLANYWKEVGVALTGALALSLLILAAIAFSTRHRVQHRATADALHSAEQLALTRAFELKASDERESKLRREASMKAEIHAFNDQLLQSIKALGVMIDGLAKSSDSLNSAASQTRESSGEVAEASNRAATHVTDVASAADELASAANEIAEKTRESSSIFQEAVHDAEATNSAIERLNSAVLQVDSVVGLIRKIADQTNLLALNATIETARAGEAGKGFSVVASEVKALANQTSKATQNIQMQINAIREASADSIKVLRGISEQMASIEAISSNVNSSVANHRSSARDIANNIHATAREIDAVSKNAGALAQATTLSCRSVSDVIHVAGELNNEAKRISVEADNFFKSVQTAWGKA